jgi:hypothetical protein
MATTLVRTVLTSVLVLLLVDAAESQGVQPVSGLGGRLRNKSRNSQPVPGVVPGSTAHPAGQRLTAAEKKSQKRLWNTTGTFTGNAMKVTGTTLKMAPRGKQQGQLSQASRPPSTGSTLPAEKGGADPKKKKKKSKDKKGKKDKTKKKDKVGPNERLEPLPFRRGCRLCPSDALGRVCAQKKKEKKERKEKKRREKKKRKVKEESAKQQQKPAAAAAAPAKAPAAE